MAGLCRSSKDGHGGHGRNAGENVVRKKQFRELIPETESTLTVRLRASRILACVALLSDPDAKSHVGRVSHARRVAWREHVHNDSGGDCR
jgi:hypothetical protein